MKTSTITALALSMMMLGCGGSGGNSSTSKSSTPTGTIPGTSSIPAVASSTAAVSSLALSSAAASSAPVLTGVFLDAAVKNIGFRTATQQGFTNSNGEFKYRAGELVSFFIGNLELPAVMADAILTPLNIAHTNSLSDNQLINILRLLQSLDADANPANGIEITAAALAVGARVDFTLPAGEFAQLPAVQALLQAAGSSNRQLVSAAQALAHFQTTLELINGPASSKSSQSSIPVVVTSSAPASSAALSSTPLATPSSAPESSSAAVVTSSSMPSSLASSVSVASSAGAALSSASPSVASSSPASSSADAEGSSSAQSSSGAGVNSSSSADSSALSSSAPSSNEPSSASSDSSSSDSSSSDSSSSDASSSDASSSTSSDVAQVRPAKIEGFAAYANVTGGAGGPVVIVSTGTQLNAALCGRAKTAPIVIMVKGTINHGNTTAQGCNTQADVIELKQMSNISIIGVGTSALFDEIGIHVRDASNIIIQNVHVRNVKKSGSPISNGGDAIGMETNVNRVWIDHNWLEASGGEKDGYDSLLDMKAGVTNVTVSYNLYNDSSRAGLIGSSDSDDANTNITFHHNWYKNIEQRTPLIRHALVHIYNNYWSNETIDYMFHAINSRMDAKALVESNYFYNVNNPLIASDDSSAPGCWQTNNENTVLPSIYYSRTVGAGALVIPAVVNGQLQSTCSVSVPYSVTMDRSADVPAIVMANVGVGKIYTGGEWGSSSSSSADSSAPVSSAVASSVASSLASSDAVVGASSSLASVASSTETSSSVAAVTNVIFSENFNGASASNFYTTYRVNASSQSLYKKTGGTPVFADGNISLSGARFTVGETGKDLDLSKPYRLSFDVVQASGTNKVQIFVDTNSTSGTTIFNAAANTLVAGQRFVLNSTVGTAQSFIQIRAETGATLAIDNLVIEQIGAATGSSSNSSAANSSANANSSGANLSSTASSTAISSSSSSAPYIPADVNLSADCISLATNPNVNWHDTALQTDQEIVECLYQSLGRPVGYGENAQGGYDPNGNSKLTIITKKSSVSVEQQVLDAISGDEHNWIVFDKIDFAQPSEIGMYRLGCNNATVQSILGATEAECVNYQQWCANNGVSNANCVTQFFNVAMNKSNNPIRNPVVGSHKSLDGRGSEAYFLFSGFAIGKDFEGSPVKTAESVIMTHLSFKGAGHTEDHYVDPDMIRSTGASHDIWIHKNTFDTTGDSAFDVKVGAHNITMSFNRLVNVKRAVLHGSSDSHTIDTQITTTMHNNAFVTTDDSYELLGNTLRRVPLLRHGKTHMFNNVFVNYRNQILSLRVGASAFMEDSVFMVNVAHQEKSTVAASLAELSANQFKDISDGYFRNERNFLWFGSSSCVLNDTTKTALTASNGTVADLAQNYSAASLNMINGWRFAAGQDLVDYVTLTAGKHGAVPFNSPLSADRVYMEALSPTRCQ